MPSFKETERQMACREDDMKMRTIVPMILGLAVVVSGCWVRSLNPIYTEKDVTFDPKLVGTWVVADDDGEEETMVFRRSGENAYELVYVSRGKAGTFDAKLVKIDDTLFVDISPKPPQGFEGGYTLHLIRSHSFVKIEIGEKETRIIPLDHEWLKKALDAGKVKLAHEVVDELVVLTASTEDLQKFLRTHADDKKAFPKASVLRRQ